MAERAPGGMVVAITGGARGIGAATARACARAGMRVAVGDLDAEPAQTLAGQLGSGHTGMELDVRDRDSFETFLDEAESRLGPLDVLVNNAGVFHLGPFVDEQPERTQRMLDINVGGVITGCSLAAPRMVARGRGHIVNLASSAGQIPPPGAATYAASKHAIVGFTRALHAELHGDGVWTTLVMPGIVKTDMIGGFASARGTREIEPDMVADAIVKSVRSGRPEVFVPPELGGPARLIAGLPPRPSRALKRVLGVDTVMTDADPDARSEYEARIDR
ncbi:MAG: SDR family oxidoreductase [Solirubrobacterales bacterium]